MPVGGLLLALGLELDVAADRLDDDVLGAEVGHVHQDLVRVVVVLDARDAVAAEERQGSNSIGLLLTLGSTHLRLDSYQGFGHLNHVRNADANMYSLTGSESTFQTL